MFDFNVVLYGLEVQSPMLLIKRVLLTGLLMCAMAGCSLPAAGPTAGQVEKSADPRLDLYLVNVNPGIVQVLSSYKSDGFPEPLRVENHRPSISLRPGDVIGVNIYETGGAPLFGGGSTSGAASGQASTQPSVSAQSTFLPAQIIESDGQIIVPFVGRVQVAGLTPAQAAEEIGRQLARETVRPQVIVSLVGNKSNAVSVGGEVNRAGLVPLSLRGERLLDVIADAGGPRLPAVETDVRLIRGATVAAIPLQQVLANPQDNIVIRPYDTVVLMHNPKTFVVLGAVAKVAQYTLNTERVTVAEGIARAGGTVDAYGSLAGVYLLRNEPTPFAKAVLQADRSAVETDYVASDETRQLLGPSTKMIYRINLTQSGGYFFAQNIALRDKDIILVANADTAQLQKAMTLIRAFTGTYFDISRGATYYIPTAP